MELIFLGTGAGVPSKERNVSSIALSMLQELNSTWLFDCGEATQHQILRTHIKPRKINKIFITHLHGDHIFGLPGFLSSRSFQGGTETLTLYGPKGIKKYVETSLEVSGTHLTYPLDVFEIENDGVLFESNDMIVECKKLEHGIPSYGFKIIEKDKIGELLVDKLKDLGVRPGPIYKEIKENEETVLPNGTIINRKDVIGPPKKGRMICILGDTRNTIENQSFVENADVLVHEATFSADKQELAHQYFHSTTTEAASLAEKSNVQLLILTHISSRYLNSDILQLENEAKAIFSNTIISKDFYHYQI